MKVRISKMDLQFVTIVDRSELGGKMDIMEIATEMLKMQGEIQAMLSEYLAEDAPIQCMHLGIRLKGDREGEDDVNGQDKDPTD